MVEIYDSKSNYLGFGHYQPFNIAIKILGFCDNKYNDQFWFDSISNAYKLRSGIGLTRHEKTNAYRLVHGEGDLLPGLIIDIYDQTAVIQCHSIGMNLMVNEISDALLKTYDGKLQQIFNKSKETLSSHGTDLYNNGFIIGNQDCILIKENNIQFEIHLQDSQKTGFFLDQRENRSLLMDYSYNKAVLNTFCYTGGFSLYALKGNCIQVDSVDSSSKAIQQLQNNIILNSYNNKNHQSICDDAIQYLNSMSTGLYDLIVLDPPAFAKNISKRHNAIQAYKRINLMAMLKIKSKGILFTFSCSQVVTEELFYNTIIAAGIESGRKVRILHKLHQGPDHPINLYHPEGSYLKGLVLEVD